MHTHNSTPPSECTKELPLQGLFNRYFQSKGLLPTGTWSSHEVGGVAGTGVLLQAELGPFCSLGP